MIRYYDFDQIIPRGVNSGSYSAKWQGFEYMFPGYDVKGALGMWIADMDFLCPREVISAVKNRAEHGIYGYTSQDAVNAFKKAAVEWYERRYGYKVHADWMLFIGGVVPSLNSTIQEFTETGDGVIIQNPVYYPFSDSIINCGRTIRNNQLIETKGYYTMDFEGLEKLAKGPNTKLIILCSPHNPVGRVWTKDELYRVCKLCSDNGVLIFSDEIHADLIMKGHKFITAGKLPDEISQNLIISFAPSKTFNIAGLGASLIVVPNKEIRERLAKRMLINHYPNSNVFGPIAGEAAYIYGDSYVDELMEYVESNIDYAIEYTRENLKGVRIIKPEGTYLAWVDFRGTRMGTKEIYSFVLEKAKIAVDLGEWFGPGGEGFVRFNLACPRSTVVTAMDRLKNAFRSL